MKTTPIGKRPDLTYVALFTLVLLALALVLPQEGQAGTWAFTGSLNTARSGETILLPNGKVLVAGGWADNAPLKSCELYNPATGLWSSTGSMNEGRTEFALVRLSNGKVLAIGGRGLNGDLEIITLKSCELYDPDTGLWGPIGPLAVERSMFCATLLANGRVLVAGGTYYDTVNHNWVELNSAELYNPGTGLWSDTGSLKTARHGASGTLLSNGKVLVAGGNNIAFYPNSFLNTCELYDPDQELFIDTGSFKYGRAFAACGLPNGKVLMAGGWGNGPPNNSALSSCQLYDPGTGTWSDTGSLHTARQEQRVVLLPSGQVLTFGGYGLSGALPYDVILKSAELYNPSTGIWGYTGSLNTARVGPSGTLLPNGKVLTAGGSQGEGNPNLTSAELYTPGDPFPAINLLLLY